MIQKTYAEKYDISEEGSNSRVAGVINLLLHLSRPSRTPFHVSDWLPGPCRHPPAAIDGDRQLLCLQADDLLASQAVFFAWKSMRLLPSATLVSVGL